MLKTTEQQLTAPDEYRKVRPAPVEETQTAQNTATELVLEPQNLENIQSLIDEFSLETKRRKRKWWTVWGAMVGSIPPVFGLTLFLLRSVYAVNWWYVGLALTVQSLIPLISIAPLSALMQPSKRQRTIIDHLIASKDVRAISALFGGLGIRNKAARYLVVGALTALLPHLNESDTTWLSDDDQRWLLSGLKYTNSELMSKYYGDGWTDYIVASLHALSQVGDSRALSLVEALAIGAASTDDGQRIRQAAIDCLVPLRKRVDRDRVGQHLLRSSDAPESIDMLLIPAAETPDGDIRELPRASAEK